MNQLQEFAKRTREALPGHGNIPAFRPGDTLRVQVKIKEGSKERLQAFEGLCIGRKNRCIHSSFRMRKILAGEGVERVFPLYSPLITIERLREGVVRRAQLDYLRDRQGKRARIKEKKYFSEKNARKASSVQVSEAAKTSVPAKASADKAASPQKGASSVKASQGSAVKDTTQKTSSS